MPETQRNIHNTPTVLQEDVDLTTQFHTQNEYLQTLMDNTNTKSVMSNYILEQNDQMIYINFYLFVIYYLVLWVYSTFFFYKEPTKSWSIYLQIIVMVFLHIVPFVIVRIEKYIYSCFIFLRDLIYSNVYLASD